MASIQQSISGSLRQLQNLNLSQRVAIALGLALVVGSLVWMANWAATPEMVPLLGGQSLSDTEIAEIRTGLLAMNETHKVEGARVLVRADANRPAIMAQLGMMNRMPADTSVGFASMIKEANPWLPQEENNRRWTVALAAELNGIIGQINGVKSASVVLNLGARERGFSRNQPESKASVMLALKGGERVSRGLATSVARLISGAVRGLPTHNVEVVDATGGSIDWDDEAPGSASGLTRLQRQMEQETAAKIADQLRFDRNLRVSVQVVLEHSAVTMNEAKPTDAAEVEKIITDQSNSRNRPGGQPGVEVNTGAVAAGGGSGADGSTLHSEEIRYQPGMSHTTTTNPAGVVKEVFAAINVSYSYLASIYKRRNPDAKEPQELDIQKIFDEQKPRIEAQAAKLVQPPDPKQVDVQWYYDSVEAEAATTTAASSGFDMPMDLASRYGPIAGLGVLALAAMFFMFRMARLKDGGEVFGLELGLPKEAIEAARKAAEDIDSVADTIERSGGPRGVRGVARGGGSSGGSGAGGGVEYGGGEGIAQVIPVPLGMAAEGLLEAQEVDERTVQISKMVEQVAAMTKDDEEGIGALVEKWIDQTDRER